MAMSAQAMEHWLGIAGQLILPVRCLPVAPRAGDVTAARPVSAGELVGLDPSRFENLIDVGTGFTVTPI